MTNNHLIEYLDYVESKRIGTSHVSAAIITGIVQRLKNDEYSGIQRAQAVTSLLNATQPILLEWTERKPQLLQELYAACTTTD